MSAAQGEMQQILSEASRIPAFHIRPSPPSGQWFKTNDVHQRALIHPHDALSKPTVGNADVERGPRDHAQIRVTDVVDSSIGHTHAKRLKRPFFQILEHILASDHRIGYLFMKFAVLNPLPVSRRREIPHFHLHSVSRGTKRLIQEA
jgi:hypothetical protein